MYKNIMCPYKVRVGQMIKYRGSDYKVIRIRNIMKEGYFAKEPVYYIDIIAFNKTTKV